jgi:hypothetical protein
MRGASVEQAQGQNGGSESYLELARPIRAGRHLNKEKLDLLEKIQQGREASNAVR